MTTGTINENYLQSLFVSKRKKKKLLTPRFHLTNGKPCDDAFFAQISYSQKSPEMQSHQVPAYIVIIRCSLSTVLVAGTDQDLSLGRTGKDRLP